MEEKINDELRKYGLSRSDLTYEELEDLKKELNLIENGVEVLDGILFSKGPSYKKKIIGND